MSHRGPHSWIAGSLRRAALVLSMSLAAPALHAQSQPAEPTQPSLARWRTLIAADEQNLWLARVDRQKAEGSETELFHRGVNTPFEPRPGLNAAVMTLAVSGATLYAFCEDGSLYSLSDEQWTRERDLPGRKLPLDLVGGPRGLYALILSPSPGALRHMLDGSPPSSQPFNAEGARLTVARYDTQEWGGIAACPPEIQPGARTRLARIDKAVWLLVQTEPDAIGYYRCDADQGSWSSRRTLPLRVNVTDFWVTQFGGAPAVVYTMRGSGPVPDVAAVRLFGGWQPEHENWLPANLQLSGLPAEAGTGEYRAAAGFNQHIALLLEAVGGVYVRFGLPDRPPAEKTISLNELLQEQMGPSVGGRWFHYMTPIVIAVVLAALFMLRRGTIRAPLKLPAEFALAYAFQRLAGLLIDLGLVGLTAALLLNADWQTGVQELFRWALGTSQQDWPGSPTLVWWLVTELGYAGYSLVMELAFGRTLGKLAVGTRVLSERGVAPTLIQITIRNVARVLELLPPLWLLAFLVILSRNRQRLGDIFARTIVVRRLRKAED